jgi:hypothetical protein
VRPAGKREQLIEGRLTGRSVVLDLGQ